ncbi:hypothetical protein, partial [Aeromonas hydrophila]
VSMMAALKVMTYFKVSLSTHNWDRAIKNAQPRGRAEHATSVWRIQRIHSCSIQQYQPLGDYTNINLTC